MAYTAFSLSPDVFAAVVPRMLVPQKRNDMWICDEAARS